MTTPGFHEDWFGEASQQVLAKLTHVVRKLPGIIVEIGAWEGRSTVALAKAADPRLVHTVDTWNGSGHEISEGLAAERDVFAQWQANMAAFTAGNVVPHRCDWREYVGSINEPVALAFIDAEHTRTEVADTIRALLPYIVPGGIICGDDAHYGPVRQGVEDVLSVDRLFIDATVWIWQRPLYPVPACEPSDAQFKTAIDTVRPIWQEYAERVSPPEMAASWMTLAYLRHLCEATQPRRILDLGSGISSAVFRQWARDNHCSVFTIDDDREWLEKTERFLRSWALPCSGLIHEDDPRDLPDFGEFDLVFHDFAAGDVRGDVAEWAASKVAPGGFIVFDDAQNDTHRAAYEAAAVKHGLTLYPLPRTLDLIERWSLLGAREKAVEAPQTAIPALAEMYRDRCQTPSDIFEHLPRMVELAVDIDAQHIIELGSRSGVSTVAWLYALEQTGGRLTTVDLDGPPQIGCWDRWRHIQGDDLSPAVLAQLEPADIVFIDTSHHLWQTRAELAVYRHLAKRYIVCHDSLLAVPMGYTPPPLYPVRVAIKELVDAYGHGVEYHENCNGLAIIDVRGAT